MKIDKKIYMIPVLIIFVFNFIVIFYTQKLSHLYFGITYEMDIKPYLLNIAIYSCYAFSIFMTSENFLTEYGCYLIIRQKTRIKVFWKLVVNLIKTVLYFEIVKIVSYISLMLIIRKKIEWDIVVFIRAMLLYLVTISLLLLIQVIIEVFVDARTALVATLGAFSIMTFVGAYIYNMFYYNISEKVALVINFFLVSNYTMSYRTETILDGLNIDYYLIVIALASLFVVVTKVAMHFFTKKDLI